MRMFKCRAWALRSSVSRDFRRVIAIIALARRNPLIAAYIFQLILTALSMRLRFLIYDKSCLFLLTFYGFGYEKVSPLKTAQAHVWNSGQCNCYWWTFGIKKRLRILLVADEGRRAGALSATHKLSVEMGPRKRCWNIPALFSSLHSNLFEASLFQPIVWAVVKAKLCTIILRAKLLTPRSL